MVTEINRDELKQKLDHPRKFVLVEALPAHDFRTLHLPGAINIPADQVRTLAPELLPNKDVEVIVYCAGPACHASENAANALTELGYSNVRHFVGGKQDWISADLPVVRNDESKFVA
jgi:rhodanese-related sulfurtransferase